MTSSPLTFLGALVVESLVGKVQLLGARIQDFSSDVAADRRTVVARIPSHAHITSSCRFSSRSLLKRASVHCGWRLNLRLSRLWSRTVLRSSRSFMSNKSAAYCKYNEHGCKFFLFPNQSSIRYPSLNRLILSPSSCPTLEVMPRSFIELLCNNPSLFGRPQQCTQVQDNQTPEC
jgi:hypothetical protein